MENIEELLSQTSKTRFSDNLSVLVAYIVLVFDRRWHRRGTSAWRTGEIKAEMISRQWSNGKAAAYSKLVESLASELTKAHGSSIFSAKSDFWKHWEASSDFSCKSHLVHSFVRDFLAEYRINAIKGLCMRFDIHYGN